MFIFVLEKNVNNLSFYFMYSWLIGWFGVVDLPFMVG